MSLVLNRTWGRLHKNGVFAVVDEHCDEEGSVTYRAGALRFGQAAALRSDLPDFSAAQWLAESEACQDGHSCGSECGEWVAVPERRKVPRFGQPAWPTRES